MSRFFSRWLPCVTLLAWSSILLYFYFSGRIVNSLHPTFRPGVLIAGVVMLFLAAVLVWAPGSADMCLDGECAQPLARMKIGKILTFAILILPIGAATLAAPQGFSANTILNRGIALDVQGISRPAVKPVPAAAPAVSDSLEPPLPTKDGSQAQTQTEGSPPDAQGDEFIPKTPEGHLALQVIDLLYAAQDSALRKDLDNKTVELTGQMMPDTVSNVSGNRFKLVRMFMVCCAADARPVAALVEGREKPEMPEMAWVKVVGKATFPLEGGRTIAVVQADRVSETAPPEETMLY